MRLWHALDRQLLAPFQYFGVADTADLKDVGFQGGSYNTAELGHLYTGDDIRAALVLKQLTKVVGTPRQMRALGFCATVEHAQYMAKYFNDRNLPAVAVSGDTREDDRKAAIDALRRGDLCCIFSRDVFNEGVDIPEADTILLLRPTESVTVFLQQLGRGLRRHEDKDVCTILDFVANYRREFRFDLRLRALTGIPRRGLLEAAEEGFPYLPSGCHIELERQARERVLGHLKESIRTNRRVLTNELRVMTTQLGDGEQPTLASFLHETGIELEDVAKAGGWTRLRERGRPRDQPAHRGRADPGTRPRPHHPPRRHRTHRCVDRVAQPRPTARAAW